MSDADRIAELEKQLAEARKLFTDEFDAREKAEQALAAERAARATAENDLRAAFLASFKPLHIREMFNKDAPAAIRFWNEQADAFCSNAQRRSIDADSRAEKAERDLSAAVLLANSELNWIIGYAQSTKQEQLEARAKAGLLPSAATDPGRPTDEAAAARAEAFQRKAKERAAAAHRVKPPAPERRRPQCTAKTKRGAQCPQAAFSLDGLCSTHAASQWHRYQKQLRSERSSPAGSAKPSPRAQEVTRLFSEAVREEVEEHIRAGRLPPDVRSAAADAPPADLAGYVRLALGHLSPQTCAGCAAAESTLRQGLEAGAALTYTICPRHPNIACGCITSGAVARSPSPAETMEQHLARMGPSHSICSECPTAATKGGDASVSAASDERGRVQATLGSASPEVGADPALAEIVGRIDQYLAVGGLWNPDLMEHDKVRDLLIGVRALLEKHNAKSRKDTP